MKKCILFLFFVIIPCVFSQEISFTRFSPPIPVSEPNWAVGEWVVSSNEPFGRPSGVYVASESAIYVAVPDTILNSCVVVYKSTNDGINWYMYSHIGPNNLVSKTKMVKTGNDSIYVIFLLGTSIYCSNVTSLSMYQFTSYTNIRDFDVAVSGQNALHLIIDLNSNNDIRQYGSTNGGATWPINLYISSTGAIPRIAFNSTGDTCIINYFAVLTADTGSSRIRNFRFRESTPGTLVSIGFTDPVPQGTFKDQFQSVLYKGKAWLFYTTGTTGNIDFNCIQSNNGGANYGSPFTIGALPSRDEYWFDVQYYTFGNGGVDLIYYSDSLATPSNNTTDKLFYSYINYTTPTIYSTPFQISQHWPFWSNRMYVPSIIEFYDAAGNLGVIWVGGPSPNKLYYDGSNLMTKIRNNYTKIPEEYFLGQNYPNPFNPITKIDFSIPQNGNVTLKIYDINGREVKTLIDKEMPSGNYTVDFDASELSSGTYFYKLNSGSFSQTKKMILIK